MIAGSSKPVPIEMKTRLCQVVLENRISSIERLSQLTGMDEEEAKTALEELVSEGSLAGKFSDDGSRFFLSDIKVSDAPILGPADTGPEIVVKDTKVSKMVALSGFILMIGSSILRGITIMGESMEKVNKADAVLFLQDAKIKVGNKKLVGLGMVQFKRIRMTLLKQRNGPIGDPCHISMNTMTENGRSIFNFQMEDAKEIDNEDVKLSKEQGGFDGDVAMGGNSFMY